MCKRTSAMSGIRKGLVFLCLLAGNTDVFGFSTLKRPRHLVTKPQQFFLRSGADLDSLRSTWSPNFRVLAARTEGQQIQHQPKRHRKRILFFFVLITMLTVFTPRAATAAVKQSAAIQNGATLASRATGIATTPVCGAVENQLSIRLVYAALMGGILGKERSLAKHSAGVRTMALVAMGACAFTVCSAFGFLEFAGRYDPSRMAANVASGVGFIGAGVITTGASQNKASPVNVVHGLTTAATIWLSAAVGVACGVGMFRVATTAALTTISILRLGRIKPKAQPTAFTNPLEHKMSSDEHIAHKAAMEASDALAEIHDTAVWDEHVQDAHLPVEPEVVEHGETTLPLPSDTVQSPDMIATDAKVATIIDAALRQNSTTLSGETLQELERMIQVPSLQSQKSKTMRKDGPEP